MSIIIGADLVPTNTNYHLFRDAKVEDLFGEELLGVLSNADYRIFNLEVPLVDTESPIEKYGPALIASTDTVAAYKKIGIGALTLANNHIFDQGVNGLLSTLSVLKENEIVAFGAGENLAEASTPLLVDVKGKKIGVYACAEHEFSIASEKAPGANPFDPLESLDHILTLKNNCDFLVVLYHGGKEQYRYPSPQLQKICRKIVDKGADLVICQHSHCVGCEEKYNNSTIVYGQGNALFDMLDNEYWRSSLLVNIGDDFRISYIPITKEGNVVRLANDDRADEIIRGFNERSAQIQNPGFIENNYKDFAKRHISNYLASISGRRTFMFRALNKLTKGKYAGFCYRRKYGKKQLLIIKNLIECEAHRELFLSGID